MAFVEPMLAAPLKDLEITPGQWTAEEKIDGHRLIVSVGERNDLFGRQEIIAWSRNGIERLGLPGHMLESLRSLPAGLYDGELLVPGTRSFGVTVLENADSLVFMAFDLLESLGRPIDHLPQVERRALLEATFMGHETRGVALIPSYPVDSMDQVLELRDKVWARDGEGLILKDKSSTYSIGKRSKAWRKIKQLKSDVLTVIGFRMGQMGPNSIVVLEDGDGNQTTVKWRNYVELDRIQSNPEFFLGKKLRIEYQERTNDGSYRHPRWDRWEDK